MGSCFSFFFSLFLYLSLISFFTSVFSLAEKFPCIDVKSYLFKRIDFLPCKQPVDLSSFQRAVKINLQRRETCLRGNIPFFIYFFVIFFFFFIVLYLSDAFKDTSKSIQLLSHLDPNSLNPEDKLKKTNFG